MADLLGDGNVKATWVAAVANISAPTTTELNGGVDLQLVITKEGLAIEPEQAAVDNTALASRDETEDAGTVKYSIELTVKRQDTTGADIGWNTLVDRALGYLVVRRTQAHEDAYAAGDEVEVYPVRCGRPRMAPPALNEAQRFMVKLFNHTAPDTRATVAA